jgi:3-phytase
MMRKMTILGGGWLLPVAALALLASGCAPMRVATPALPAAAVTAVAETAPVGTVAADAADDPAIWRNAANPAASLIVGTDKQAGLYVYGLDGAVRSFTAAGQVNNVDLRGDVDWNGQRIVLVGASNRTTLTDPHLSLFALNTASGGLRQLADLSAGATGEAYGFCFGQVGPGLPRAYVVTKAGTVLELAIEMSATGTPTTRVLRRFGVATQAEGCVVDDRTGQLYLGEEDVGIWRFDLHAAQPTAIAFATVGAEDGLVADVEGLAIVPDGAGGGMLLASSQGDNAYALFDLATGTLRGRFRIGGTGEATSDTDGIELILGDFGPAFPQGLMVAQDGDNAPAAQNFKLVSWADVRRVLGLR